MATSGYVYEETEPTLRSIGDFNVPSRLKYEDGTFGEWAIRTPTVLTNLPTYGVSFECTQRGTLVAAQWDQMQRCFVVELERVYVAPGDLIRVNIHLDESAPGTLAAHWTEYPCAEGV